MENTRKTEDTNIESFELDLSEVEELETIESMWFLILGPNWFILNG